MQKTAFPVVLNQDTELPIYITSAGINYIQESVNRDHGYKDYHWFQCNEGKGEIHINGQTLVLEKGSGLFIPKNEAHSYNPISQRWLTDWFTFNGFAVRQLLNSLGFYKHTIYNLYDSRFIREKIEQCIRAGNIATDHKKLSVMTYDLIISLDAHISNKSGQIRDKKINQVIEYINVKYNQLITIEDMANILHVTPQYLCRLFKSATGKRPFEYVNMVRIQKSKELMLNTDMTIQEISYSVGFETPSYYGKWFKQLENTTPGSFRKHYRG